MSTIFGDWILNLDEVRHEYHRNQPFPHVIIDGFLREDIADGLADSFPLYDKMPRSRDYIFGKKRELSSVAEQGPFARTVCDGLLSSTFADALSFILDKRVVVDETFHGGGFHQGASGSFLDTHIDFNIHPLRSDYLRTANVLLYLTRDWKEEWDGCLLLRSSPGDAPTAIRPQFNRGVIMETSERSFHGYRELHLPNGITRKSLAAYAYTTIESGSVAAHTTGWAPEQASLLKRIAARRFNVAVQLKNRLLGSATARHR